MIRRVYRELRNTYYRFLTCLSPELNTKARYRQFFGKKLDLDNPQTFEEKLLYLKIKNYIHNPTVIQCADKVAVREYVSKNGYGHLLNDVIGVYDRVEDIPWQQLPDQFALKWNFGATYNIICDDKSQLDISEAQKLLKRWGKQKYWLDYSEMQYKYCPKQIICEKYLDTKQGFLPYDYKLYCFNGKVKAILFIMDRDNNKKGGFFSPEWTYLGPASKDYRGFDITPEKPYSLDVMLECAEVLAKGFPFVRVDFYQCGDRAIFGEMTFTPAGGIHLSQINIEGKPMGTLLDISDIRKNK